MTPQPTASASSLALLERLKRSYAPGIAARRLRALHQLEHTRLARPSELLRLHEVLCFLRAYPDDRSVLDQVQRMLGAFAGRPDLRRHRKALTDSGIAGTEIRYRFFWSTAVWLARRWPGQLSVDWAAVEQPEDLTRLLHLLVPYCESPGLDEFDLTLRQWVHRLKATGEQDATFLIRRFQALPADPAVREAMFERLDLPIVLTSAPGTPSRTSAAVPAPAVYQTRPLRRRASSLRPELRRPPEAIRSLAPLAGSRLIDLAREAMVTRSRDLDVFAYADPHDVRIADCGDGLQFACIGARPERRLMLEAVYGFLTLKNGVPIGYVLASALFRSSEVAFNVFDSFRGAEAAHVFGRVLSVVHRLFSSTAFSIDPYQLGHGNDEGLRSGAFWFYTKLGFRPHRSEVRLLLRSELARMRRDPAHRSTRATLNQLAAGNVFLYLGRPSKRVMGWISPGNVGLKITAYLAQRFGADRERAIRSCSREAARLLGLRSLRGLSAGERLAWERFSPLILLLPGVAGWSPGERRALVQVVRAKGGRRESEFVSRFDRHERLSEAVLDLARDELG